MLLNLIYLWELIFDKKVENKLHKIADIEFFCQFSIFNF